MLRSDKTEPAGKAFIHHHLMAACTLQKAGTKPDTSTACIPCNGTAQECKEWGEVLTADQMKLDQSKNYLVNSDGQAGFCRGAGGTCWYVRGIDECEGGLWCAYSHAGGGGAEFLASIVRIAKTLFFWLGVAAVAFLAVHIFLKSRSGSDDASC